MASGLAVVGLGVLAGVELYARLWSGAPLALVILLVVFLVAAGYAGWLLGLVVFAAVRGPLEAGEDGASAD